MAANYNKVILAGNLTRDPQLSYLPNQTPVVEIGLAVNRKWTTPDGEKKDDTCFVDCRAYGKQAEVLQKYLTKGSPLLVEGRLQFSQWEDKSGAKRNKLRVVIEQFQFLGEQASEKPTTTAPAQKYDMSNLYEDGGPTADECPF